MQDLAVLLGRIFAAAIGIGIFMLLWRLIGTGWAQSDKRPDKSDSEDRQP